MSIVLYFCETYFTLSFGAIQKGKALCVRGKVRAASRLAGKSDSAFFPLLFPQKKVKKPVLSARAFFVVSKRFTYTFSFLPLRTSSCVLRWAFHNVLFYEARKELPISHTGVWICEAHCPETHSLLLLFPTRSYTPSAFTPVMQGTQSIQNTTLQIALY